MVGSIDPRCETVRGTDWPKPGRVVDWNSRRGNHLGQRFKPTASTGRSYGWKRADLTQKTLVPRGSSTYGARRSPGRHGVCSNLLHKPVRPALLNRALERGTRMHPRQPRAQIRIGLKLVEYLCHLADKAHLDVGAGQRIADKEFPALQRAVDIAEMICRLAVDTRMQGRAGLLQPRHIKVQHQRQPRAAFEIMPPIVISLVIGAARRRHHRALAISADDVIDDGA